ncbi:MAG: squalene--hopene cyclase [Methylicorpusculum sp.]|uniref:squalene--hopene cyclase n=1 Tax=Methylicorpusculum sp. TaxID=2713644 RepID=UPI0027231019|nr:squalene--hopene cyclase [Methylicorpusculum sp.]MDO8846466.1 squalene--hopene cyclase [Methylicorpusculum sp.]MDP2179627.1 squalene--hopene cyclase [Methylicorpusculum sp.]MDP2200671.1 squalene--hopene cyclase [Methylicorpusculum sp.]MDP3528902.1 squalene--hopene cyclase [Methylicorpusculum sp.]MDZ4152422.1 squalene--hopene cyclase [Methylicorpusculum sp.]
MFTDAHTEINTYDLPSTATAITGRPNDLNRAISKAESYLLNLQQPDGHWVFELEADCTIPSEFILFMNYLGEIDEPLQAKVANYLRSKQSEDGSYPLFTGGPGDISCSVKTYYALKLAGDSPEAPHMVRLKNYILSQGGAARANVFTRIALAMFGQIPWRGVPYIPVEIMLLPKWFPFHLDKVSYWSRTVMVPLFILCTLKATALNPKKIDVLELFVVHPDLEKHYFPERTLLNKIFLGLDKFGRITNPFIPKRVRNKAIAKAKDWFVQRLNGEDGLGAIYPAMAAAYQAMLLLGMPKEHELLVTARKAIDKLMVIKEDYAYCQPCLSPVWDTGLVALALQETDKIKNKETLTRAYDWLKSKQLKDEPGDWRITQPNLEGGGWAFQYANPHYPDVDDTGLVGFAMADSNLPDLDESIHRATRWIVGMQSKNGGYGAFDVDNNYEYLNEIPFADHGALLDPPTVDVSARCAMLMAKVCKDHDEYLPALERTINYIRSEQEADGSWFGRWGTNYIYGTWSVLIGLEQTRVEKSDPMYTRAAQWLKSVQREDGGWGEDNFSYHDDKLKGQYRFSTAFQTAWAVMGLIAAGEAKSQAVKNGVDFLLRTQLTDGSWNDKCYTAPGFPRVFYLKYHGYDKFFPLWALAKYRNAVGHP